jgi:hypothetical protein
MRNTSGLRPPWKKGECGNPKGRPRTATLSEAYREKLAEPYPRDRKGRTYAQVIADKIVRKATKGNLSCAQEVADRVEGRARQSVAVNGLPPGAPPQIAINFVAVTESKELGSVQTQFALKGDTNDKTPEEHRG